MNTVRTLPEHFVFVTERHGLEGEAAYLAGRAVPYSVDPAKPMGSWKTAWKAARKLAGAILKSDPDDASAKPLACRIYDLVTTDDFRQAMETISTGSQVFSPVHADKVGAKVE